jgi:hypothetical protein
MGKVIVRVRTLRTRKIPLFTLASIHAATIYSLDSSLKRAERHMYKMKTTITFPICNIFHLLLRPIYKYCNISTIAKLHNAVLKVHTVRNGHARNIFVHEFI